MSLTPVGAELFLAGIEYETRTNHIIVELNERAQIMIVVDAFSANLDRYNANYRGSFEVDKMIANASATEVVGFVQTFIDNLKNIENPS